jgi:glycosyltransferase involved in cell wall biosynthesis
LGWPIDARLILAPRGANHFYSADVVLNSFLILINKYKNYLKSNYYFLLLSTGYPVSPYLLAEAGELVHSGRFHLVERVLDASEMQALWSRTDVFVSAPAYDGFSAAETEGRWAGALPVLNDIPAHREWAIPDQNAWIVKPFSAENLAGTLAALLPRIDELRPIAQALNRAWIAEHADLDVQARQFLTFAESVVRRTRQ